ncbi:restriction endonuclease subunit S [Streptomyces verrucosisporus]|uniref:restriction endonuclease subunit S n=1 Tax=Streptomyces verrucosisporus TaxID=1695161 RepID=UPI0019D0C7FA|nr:restriction endonuclease subunit S [Streptomyces verrucosisporus]MBN3928972.1 restriction endonuclease subunit S [Streptomyces verrucosisporus]
MREGWKRVALGEVTREENARVGSLASEAVVLSSTKHYGLVPSNEYFKNRQIYSDDISGYKLVRRGWFAYATNHLTEGSIGLQNLVDTACVSPIYTVFSCAPEADAKFMYRLLKSDEMITAYGVHDQASVDRRGAVRYRDFKKIEVNLPSLAEQRRIAEILDEVDAQIERSVMRREKLEILAAAETAHLLEVTSNEPAVEWRTLEEVANISSGVTLGNDEAGDGAVTLPYLRVANVQDGYIDTSDIKTVSVRSSDVERFLLQEGDVLLTEGGDLDKLGRGGVWDGRISPCLHQNHVFKVRCDWDTYRSDFLAAHLASPRGKSYFLSVAKQTTNLASINSSQVKKVPVPMVPLVDQERVVASIAQWREQVDVAERDIKKLRLLQQALVNDLFAGKVRIPAESVA